MVLLQFQVLVHVGEQLDRLHPAGIFFLAHIGHHASLPRYRMDGLVGQLHGGQYPQPHSESHSKVERRCDSHRGFDPLTGILGIVLPPWHGVHFFDGDESVFGEDAEDFNDGAGVHLVLEFLAGLHRHGWRIDKPYQPGFGVENCNCSGDAWVNPY